MCNASSSKYQRDKVSAACTMHPSLNHIRTFQLGLYLGIIRHY